MASVTHNALPEELTGRLRQLESRIRYLALLRGVGLLAMVLASGIGIGIFIDMNWELSVPLRITMLSIVGLSAGWVVLRCLFRPCFSKLSQAELAAIVENSHPELAERLTSTIELNDSSLPEAERGSRYMRETLTHQASSSAQVLDFNQSFSASRALRTSLLGTFVLVVLVMPFLFSPQNYGLLWQRFFTPWGNFASGSNLYFEVDNGDRVAARGSDIILTATPRWRRTQEERPESVWLNWKDASGETDSRHMDFQEDNGVFVTTLPHVFESIDFNISSGRARTKEYHINVVEAPTVTTAMLDVQPPAYTGMHALHFDGVTGEIPVYQNSILTFQLEFNKPVDLAELAWPGSPLDRALADTPNQTFTLSADRQSAVLESTAERGGPFLFRLTDEHTLQNQEEPRRVLVITPDAAPLLELAGSDRARQARPADHALVDVLATDDIGVTALELHYEVLNGAHGTLPTDAVKLGGQSIAHRFDFDLSSLDLSDGDVVTYRIRAADERPVPGPNETWSDPRVLAINANAKSLNNVDVAEVQKQMEESLESIRDDLKQNREKVADLQKKAETDLKNNKPFQQKEKLPNLGSEQFEIARRLEQLSQQFAQRPLYQSLSEKMQEVSRLDLPEASQTIKQAEDALPKEQTEKLKHNVDQIQQAENKLEEISKQFSNLASLERDLLDLNRLADEAGQLAQQLKDLEDQLNHPPAGENTEQKQAREQELAKQQQDLQKQQQQQKEQLEDIFEKQPDLAQAARDQQLKRLAEMANRLNQLAEPEELLAETLSEEADRPADANSPQEQNSQQPSAREAQAQQQQLARDAAQLALDTARQLGAESPAAQEAAAFAKECFT